MTNIELLDNYNYGLLVILKYDSLEFLENIVDSRDIIKLPILSLLSLYLMDTNNGDSEILSKNEIAAVHTLINKYKNNPKGYIGIEQKDLKYILSNCKSKRVDRITNKEIANILAEYNNRLYEGIKPHLVRIENLNKILDEVK